MAAMAVAWPAAALLIRPDRDDAEYRELASRYPSSIALGASAGDAVLIAPRWLLTGGRQAQALKSTRAVNVSGARYEVQSVHLHPSNAVALVLLRSAVGALEPSRIYRANDERGKAAAVAARGRAFINTIDRVERDTLALRLKKLDEASDLQGALVPDELGAPLYVEVDGEPLVAGVSTDAGKEWQVYARISSYAGWIDDTMFAAGVAEARRTPR